MQMTESEIVRRYEHGSEKPVKMIQILAELNACPKKDIREILENHGCKVPHYGNRYTGKVFGKSYKGGKKVEKTDNVKEALENAATTSEPVIAPLRCQPSEPVEIWTDNTPPAIIDLVHARMTEIDEKMKPLEMELEDMAAEYNILKAWLEGRV